MERKDNSSLRLQETRSSLETVMSPWGEGLDPSQPRDKAIVGTVVRYQEMPNQEAIADELKNIADVIHDTDLRMLKLRQRIEQTADTPTEEELLLERFSRVDLTMD